MKTYPLGDRYKDQHAGYVGIRKEEYRAIATSEKRCPKAGEWYLSGAIVAAYRAKNNLSTEYHIAKLVKGKLVQKWEIIGEE